MAQFQSGKYTIAWFKLAEFVVRKEKERALGIYRLLAYSLHDEGLASQLEGDLLLSFDDNKASDSYVKAAGLYEKNGKLMQAAAVYEHLILIQPQVLDHAYTLLKLYKQLHNETKIAQSLSLLVRRFVATHASEASAAVSALITQEHLSVKHQLSAYEYLIRYLVEKEAAQEIIYKSLEHTLMVLSQLDGMYVTSFLSTVHALDAYAYAYACAYSAQKVEQEQN